MRFHIKATGDPGICLARRKPCPLDSEHFESLKEARAAAEQLLADEYSQTTLAAVSSKASAAPPEAIVIAGTTHPVVDDDEVSRFFCKACGKRFSYEDSYTGLIGGERGYCPCGVVTLLGPENLSVQKSSLWLLDASTYGETDNVLYHVTTRPNWREEIAQEPTLQLHLGDLVTTQQRVNDMVSVDNAKPPFYLHRVRLRPTPEASVKSLQDMSEEWHELGASQDIHVYLNQWENPGALSVMTLQSNLLIEDDPKALSFQEARF